MYDKTPSLAVGTGTECSTGWQQIIDRLRPNLRGAVCIETYPGVFLDEVEAAFAAAWPEVRIIRAADAFLSEAEIKEKFSATLTEDPVFGSMRQVELKDFLDDSKVHALQTQITAQSDVVVIGTGATILCPTPALLIYADMARWELQMRQRDQRIANLGLTNFSERAALKYKRAFFLDWRAADRTKQKLFARMDYVLDTNIPNEPRLISGESFRRGLSIATTQPFRVVPFFDPGPWGGHWMESVCQLTTENAPNHAWCFDCVPEENSILFAFGDERVEVPSLDIVLSHPRELLGDDVYRRFGAEFPIRFDFLDTIGGGNLSLQVHPLTEYIQQHFGMDYTQDESYYMLDAEPDAVVYLGLKEGIDRGAMVADLEAAQAGDLDFPATKYVNTFPARKHDHFLIPAGTIHCSGKGSMVLEISATPYIFTFKLWDWGRLGLDGRPRPIHLEHGLRNIQWDRTTSWVQSSLINQFVSLAEGKGWREERTGLHPLEFIETRRHWFTDVVPHDTRGTVNVLNLVEGEEAIVESPTGAFKPFVVHFAETFIVPAAVGEYTIRPHGPSEGRECATMLAYVRAEG